MLRTFSTARCCCNHYQTLGVPPSATQAEIKHAFRRLAQKYHPDKNKDPKAVPIFHKINEAHNTLENADERKKYDIALQPRFTSPVFRRSPVTTRAPPKPPAPRAPTPNMEWRAHHPPRQQYAQRTGEWKPSQRTDFKGTKPARPTADQVLAAEKAEAEHRARRQNSGQHSARVEAELKHDHEGVGGRIFQVVLGTGVMIAVIARYATASV